jgi:predicted DNA-binding transcriptional regulator YafY
MSQRHQLQRILEIDRRIRSWQFPNAESLSVELEVGSRVIFNDRRFMVDQLRAPIEFDRKRGGWRYTSQTYSLPSTLVTEGELLAAPVMLSVAV